MVQQKDIIIQLNGEKSSKEIIIQEIADELECFKNKLLKEEEKYEFVTISIEKYISEIEELKICETENSQKYINLESELNNNLILLKDELFKSKDDIESLQIEVWYFISSINIYNLIIYLCLFSYSLAW